eukprot:gnl/MRDRNA2_/MRDRNA2_111788_c0_seq1.p1 gnl/MRDRNA2_/MRDRNA2_111788_c0~~gnl/MRDRNA2_/MRDRNA2_111788_c0_seq1.p1  ORF type:complete len:275 (+),score=46.35 gnl/MRDRNA2_/MRDRNA2_111788_c0_seq1:50-826(+)
MALLVLITYVFAILFTQLAVETELGDELFANIAHSMYSLLIYATLLDDLIDFTNALRYAPGALWVLLMFAFIYIALAALTVMNMLIGVLCEVVSEVAEGEREEIRTETLTTKMDEIVQRLDTDSNGFISYKEFAQIMSIPDALTALEEVGVNPVGVVDFAELFFLEDGKAVELTFEHFMEVILDLRETNSCTVKDILGVWRKIRSTLNEDLVETKSRAKTFSQTFDEKMAKANSRLDNMQDMLSSGVSDVMKLSSKYG